MVLHGIYENGKIEITEKDLPLIKAKVEIIIKNPLSKKITKVRPKGKSVSSAVMEERYEQ